MPIADDILNFCVALDQHNDAVMKDCNQFVKRVAGNFSVSIDEAANADQIVDDLSKAPFTKTTMNPAVAMSWAKDGLVVAGMKATELSPAYGNHAHGHVAIVHDMEDSAHPGFPMASWGTLGSRGKSNAPIRRSFSFRACDDHAVHFAFAPTP